MRTDLVELPRFIFEVALLDPAGTVIEEQEFREWPNLLMDAGKLWYADFARGVTGKTKLATLAIGSGTNAVETTDTQLHVEVARLAIPEAETDTGDNGLKNIRAASIVTLQVVFGPSITATVREVGVFADIASPPGAANAGTLIHRAAIGAYGLTGANQLRVRGKYNYA